MGEGQGRTHAGPPIGAHLIASCALRWKAHIWSIRRDLGPLGAGQIALAWPNSGESLKSGSAELARAMRQADISYTLTFEPAGAGTRMRWAGHVRPKGALRLVGPLITWLGIRQERPRAGRRAGHHRGHRADDEFADTTLERGG
jgi:hypothetical protein